MADTDRIPVTSADGSALYSSADSEANTEEEEFETRFMSPRRRSWILPTCVLLFILFLTVAGVFVIKRVTSLSKSSDETVSEIAEDRAGLYRIACRYADEKISEYEEKQQVYGYLNNRIFSSKITVEGDGATGYSILLDGEKAFSVFNPDSYGNGFRTECCLGTEYSAEFPKGSKATLNGITLSNPVRADYFALSDYEKSFSDLYCSDRYEIGTVFSDMNWGASLDGQELPPPVLRDGTWYFSYPPGMTKEISVTAPAGSELIVNGVMVTDVSSRTLIPYPYLSRLEENVDGVPMSFTQNLGSFFGDPVIEVIYNGQRLEAGNDAYSYMLPDSLFLGEIRITAPSDCTVRVNGISLGSAEIAEMGIPCALLSEGTTVEDYNVTKIPFYTEYAVSGLFREPEITCFDTLGNEIPADDYQSGEDRIFFPFFSYDQIPEADRITPLSFTKSYAKYVYNGSSALSANLRNLSGYMSGTSPAFLKLKEMYMTLYHNGTVYKSLSFGEPVYSGYRAYADNLYGVTVEIPFTAKRDGATFDFTVKLEVLYTFQGRLRRIVNFNEIKEGR